MRILAALFLTIFFSTISYAQGMDLPIPPVKLENLTGEDDDLPPESGWTATQGHEQA